MSVTCEVVEEQNFPRKAFIKATKSELQQFMEAEKILKNLAVKISREIRIFNNKFWNCPRFCWKNLFSGRAVPSWSARLRRKTLADRMGTGSDWGPYAGTEADDALLLLLRRQILHARKRQKGREKPGGTAPGEVAGKLKFDKKNVEEKVIVFSQIFNLPLRDTPDSELANPEQPNSELFLGLIQNSPIQNRPFQNWQIQNCLFQNSFRKGSDKGK